MPGDAGGRRAALVVGRRHGHPRLARRQPARRSCSASSRSSGRSMRRSSRSGPRSTAPCRRPPTPSVVWQRREDGAWKPVGSPSSSFATLSAPVSGSAVASETFAVAGQPGHYLRAFLAQGDFGWTDYQAKVADFATRAVAGTGPKPTMPPVPVPPIASAVTVRYTTTPVEATLVESSSGWRRQRRVGAPPAVSRRSGSSCPTSARRPWSPSGSSCPTPPSGRASRSTSTSTPPRRAAAPTRSPASLAVLGRHDVVAPRRRRRLAPAPRGRPAPLRRPAHVGRRLRRPVGRHRPLGADRDRRAGTARRRCSPSSSTPSWPSSSRRAVDPGLDPSSAEALPSGTIKGTARAGPRRQEGHQPRLRARPGTGDRRGLPRAGLGAGAPPRPGPDPVGPRAARRARAPRGRGRAAACRTPAATGCAPPGHVGLVVVPDRPLDVAPRPVREPRGPGHRPRRSRAPPIGATLARALPGLPARHRRRRRSGSAAASPPSPAARPITARPRAGAAPDRHRARPLGP